MKYLWLMLIVGLSFANMAVATPWQQKVLDNVAKSEAANCVVVCDENQSTYWHNIRANSVKIARYAVIFTSEVEEWIPTGPSIRDSFNTPEKLNK